MSRGTRRRLAAPAVSIQSEPDIPLVHRAVIERALRWAWAVLCKKWPALVTGGSEEEITERLQHLLNAHGPDHGRLAPGLRSYETVIRGAKVVSASGAIEKQPDLVFRPPLSRGVRNRGEWGLFVECKLIDGARSVSRYCSGGVARFADGEYARSMASGALVAYARDGSTPFDSLDPKLAGRYRTRAHTAGAASDVSDSVHDRSSVAPARADISLSHLWLCVR